MIFHILITIVISIAEFFICGMSFTYLMRLFSRGAFLAKFQGFSSPLWLLIALDAVALVLFITVDLIFTQGVIYWTKILFMILFSIIHLSQAIVDDQLTVTVDMTKEEYELMLSKDKVQ